MKAIILAITLTLTISAQANECTTDRDCYTPQDEAYDCLADQAYYPENYEETLDLIAMCGVTMEEYIAYKIFTSWDLED